MNKLAQLLKELRERRDEEQDWVAHAANRGEQSPWRAGRADAFAFAANRLEDMMKGKE